MDKREWEYMIKDFQLTPSDGGRFEFVVNDNLLYSKKQLGRHAEAGEIEGLFADYLEEYLAENNLELPTFDNN